MEHPAVAGRPSAHGYCWWMVTCTLMSASLGIRFSTLRPRALRARAALALNHQSPGCPMFTESAGMNQFRRVAEHPDGARLAGWRVEWHDGNALTFSQGTCEAIVLVAGRQLRIHSPLAQQHGAPGGNQVTASSARGFAVNIRSFEQPSTDGAGTSGTALAAATREHRQQTGRAGAAARGAMNGTLNPPQTFGWGGEQCHHR